MREPGGMRRGSSFGSQPQPTTAPDSAIDKQSEHSARKARIRPPAPRGLQAAGDKDVNCVMREMQPDARVETTDAYPCDSQSNQDVFHGTGNRAPGTSRQTLRDVIDTLRELQLHGDINQLLGSPSVPHLVLVGDQSSGKSSLMSAIAGLSLPRDHGTPRRCPIHIHVSRADEWSCRVTLKHDYEYRRPHHPITECDVTPADPYPPWEELEPSRQAIREFKTIRGRSDSNEIETVLRYAQAAIINPSTPYHCFIPMLKNEASEVTRQLLLEWVKKSEERPEALFSPNAVTLEVKGPDLAHLNLYDLPGVIQVTRRADDQFLVPVLQNLTREYVSRPSAIIMCAVPMDQSPQNSLALTIIKQQQAESRCIGVMTKADLLPKDDNRAGTSKRPKKNHGASMYLDMLNGVAHQTGSGYFVTSRQGSDLEQQNKNEVALFNRATDKEGQPPQLFVDFRHRCGVDKLKHFLSGEVEEEFARVPLPKVKLEVDARRQNIERRADRYFADLLPNPKEEMLKSLHNFAIEVRGKLKSHAFRELWKGKIVEPFKHRILNQKPQLNVQGPTRSSSSAPIIVGSKSDRDNRRDPRTARKRPASSMGVSQRTPRKRARGQQTRNAVKTKRTDRSMVASAAHRARSNTAAAMPLQGRSSTSVTNIRKAFKRSPIPGQLGLVSDDVCQTLYAESVKKWAPHVVTFLNSTFDLLYDEILASLNVVFESLSARAIFKESLKHIRAFVVEQKVEVRGWLERVRAEEYNSPFPMDEAGLSQLKTDGQNELIGNGNTYRVAVHIGDDISAVPQFEDMANEAPDVARKARWDISNVGAGRLETNLTAAVAVWDYYHTEASRFFDNCLLHTFENTLLDAASRLEAYLLERLGLAETATIEQELLQRLTSEAPEVEQERRELKAQKEALDRIMEVIIYVESRNERAAELSECITKSDTSLIEETAAEGVNPV